MKVVSHPSIHPHNDERQTDGPWQKTAKTICNKTCLCYNHTLNNGMWYLKNAFVPNYVVLKLSRKKNG